MNKSELASMIDITMVQNNHSESDIIELADNAVKYGCAAAFVLPCYVGVLADRLKGSAVKPGSTSGFPDGGATTACKIFEAKDNIKNGAREIDIVINIGWLKSGKYDLLFDEVKALKDTVGDYPLKSIIEVNSLTDDEICRVSELIVKAGGDFVKTGTGWNGGTKREHIQLIKKTIGDGALIKAAGGIRTLDTALDFINAGASRLGIGMSSCVSILEEIS